MVNQFSSLDAQSDIATLAQVASNETQEQFDNAQFADWQQSTNETIN